MFDRTVRKTKKDDADEAEGATRLSSSIRKIRMGTFEDTGKCKGCVFVSVYNEVLERRRKQITLMLIIISSN